MADRDTQGRYLPAHGLPGPGRTPIYDPAMNAMARKLALLGQTDEEMADFFGVDPATIYRWQHDHPAFCEAIKNGKIIADAEVAASLYRRAVGENVKVERIVRGPEGKHEVITLTQRIPGDVSAAKHWLGNRQRGRWTNADNTPADSTDGTSDLHDDQAIKAANAKLHADVAALDMIEDAV